MMIGNIYNGGQNGNIWTTEGVSPAIIAGQGVKGRGVGSCNAPKIILREDGEYRQQETGHDS